MLGFLAWLDADSSRQFLVICNKGSIHATGGWQTRVRLRVYQPRFCCSFSFVGAVPRNSINLVCGPSSSILTDRADSPSTGTIPLAAGGSHREAFEHYASEWTVRELCMYYDWVNM
ncbi:hypothetical protein M413DRAFT_160207 [Hebeloma cylindrosporum]|uniref:Uncharacterized protein n=1 Tax=Hebeloma cylindrosporum TaxID=76867 RepID=A0A0C2YJI3_HEBCY|nr:hypothetical protein M413DRAFT_160207 [Hebeloma cylindrosporum h7]